MSRSDDDLRLALDALDARQVPAAEPGWDRRLRTSLEQQRRSAAFGRSRLLIAACFAAAVLFVLLASGAGATIGLPNPLHLIWPHHNPHPQKTVPPIHSPSATPSPAASASRSGTNPTQLVIACASGPQANGISAIGSSGQVRSLVTPAGGPISQLAWSPDGRRLAYLQMTNLDSNDPRLRVLDIRTLQVTRVAASSGDAEAVVQGFAWVGPTRLVAAVLPSGSEPAVPAATRLSRVNGALRTVDAVTGTVTSMRDAGGRVLRGASPSAPADPATIAFVRYGKARNGEAPEELLLYDVATRHTRTIATSRFDPSYDGDPFSFPHISPDGAFVYTVQTHGDPGFSCTVYRTDGTKAYFKDGLGWPTPGSWLAGPGTLAFGGGRATPMLSDAINTWAPGQPRAITILRYPNGRGIIPSLTWTPLGHQIVFTLETLSGGTGELLIVDADGGNRHVLLRHGSWPACAHAPLTFP